MKREIWQTIIILFLRVNAHGEIRPHDPAGSTGCSKKFLDSEQGRCWRYCEGQSGPWCYTTSDCYTDEESCAFKTKCEPKCPIKSESGCVNQCPPSVPKNATEDPVGSTGCAKFDDRDDSVCWRHCVGSGGPRCYTSTDCKNDEEACAYKEHCGQIQCHPSHSNCVEQCEAGKAFRINVSSVNLVIPLFLASFPWKHLQNCL